MTSQSDENDFKQGSRQLLESLKTLIGPDARMVGKRNKPERRIENENFDPITLKHKSSKTDNTPIAHGESAKWRESGSATEKSLCAER